MEFAGGRTAPDDSAWLIDGELYPVNPRHEIDPGWPLLAGLWRDSRGPQTAMATRGLVYRTEGGLAHLPARGGLLDQPAWLMDAFAVMTGAAAEILNEQGG